MATKSKIGKDNEANRLQWVSGAINKISSGSRILDAGAGELKYKKYCRHLEYISQDFCQYKGFENGDNKGLQKGKWDISKIDIVSDIISIPESDKTFDAILCIEVFEHIPKPLEAIKEFNRLLRPGGYLILTAPFCSLTHFAPYHYYSGFNSYFYEYHLNELGFEIVEITPNGNWFSYIAQETRRIPKCASKYASVNRCSILALLAKISIKMMLFTLQQIEVKEERSSELLCYGYHILARKKD